MRQVVWHSGEVVRDGDSEHVGWMVMGGEMSWRRGCDRELLMGGGRSADVPADTYA